jgi:stage IV sporulation protein A
METLEMLKSIGTRNNGDVYLGVVGPVRVGKSTFIKKFMEEIVLPNIYSQEEKIRAIDELPQSGDGKTIMTVEPKFVPSNAISVKVTENYNIKIRLIDCVGYIIDNANGYLEDGKMRMVKTPWFSDAIPFDEASKIGTKKVIKDHSTLGIVVLSDGSINDFTRADYLKMENKVIEDVKSEEKPFVIVLNTKTPNQEQTLKLKNELEEMYQVPVIPCDVINLTRTDANKILEEAIEQYPVSGIEMRLPKWVSSLDENHYIKTSIKDSINKAMDEAKIIKDVQKITSILGENEYLLDVNIVNVDTGTGIVTVQMNIDESLYEKVLEELVGCKIQDKAELIQILSQFVKAKKDYDLIGNALEMAESTGYGFASSNTMNIEKPETSKVQGRHAIKVKASTNCYNIIKVDVGTTFEPVLGSKEQAEYFLDYLLSAYEKGETNILECEMFGRKFKDILQESISSKLNNLPESVKVKLQQLIKVISNKGKGNLIAFVF